MRDLAEMTPFEEQLARDLRRHAAAVDDPRSAADIAAVAMRLGRRSRFGSIGRFGSPFATVPAAWRAVVLVVLLALAILSALAIAGSQPHRPLTSNGSLVYEAQDPTGNREVIVILDPTGTRTIVPSDPALIDFCPTWSGDGSRIAYEAWGTNLAEVVVSDAQGRNAQTLVMDQPPPAGGLGPTDLAWSPDGSMIAYIDGLQLWVVPAAGGAPRMLVDTLKQGSSAPWSPDGRRLVAETYDGTGWVLETIGVDGTGARVLARLGQLMPPAGYSWSPDGSTVAYASDGRLWTVAANGSGTPVDVTGPALSAMTPYWSPDSERIAFIDAVPASYPGATGPYPGERFSEMTQVWIVDRDGGHPTNLATLPIGSGVDHLTWSPDDRSLLVAETGTATGPTVSYAQIPLDGGAPVVLASSVQPSGPFHGLGNSCPVSWNRLSAAPAP